MRAKLGLTAPAATAEDEADAALARDWLALLQADAVDYTLAWHRLADAAEGQAAALHALFADAAALDTWLVRWQARGAADPRPAAQRAQAMRQVNPRIIARNHRVEEALEAASSEGNLDPFEDLLQAIKRPYDDDPALDRYAEPAPAGYTERYRTFCGT